MIKCSNTCGACKNPDYEKANISFLRQNMSSNGRFLDIGAHIGLYALQLAQTAKIIHAFEPYPDHFKILQQNLGQKMENTQIFTHNVAIWDSDCYIDLVDVAPGQHFITSKKVERKTWRVRAIQLDSNFVMDVSAVKIDVEGGELRVLKGMVEILKRSPEVVMVIELSQPHLNRNGDKLEDLLELLDVLEFKCQNYTQRELFKAKNRILKANYWKKP